MREVQLTRGYVALVDGDDYERVSAHKWWAHDSTTKTYGRASCGDWRDGGRIYLHQFILGKKGVDHISGDSMDNRRSNLRVATKSQNGMNSRKRGSSLSAFKGVSRTNGIWFARIHLDGKQIYLGTFPTEHAAALAYDKAAAEKFGPFARPNFAGRNA